MWNFLQNLKTFIAGLAEGIDVSGGDLYGFKSVKKSGQMAQKGCYLQCAVKLLLRDQL